MTTTVPPGVAELTGIMAYADFATSASASVRRPWPELPPASFTRPSR
jgi:hypothetical protein